jgi:putative phosphoribosyl transferase
VVFADRVEAGRLLAQKIAELAVENPIVLALPRGGVPVAAEIAQQLRAPLDVAFVRKIGAPGEPELAVGAVADGSEPEIVLNDKLVQALELDEDYIVAQAARELATIEMRRKEYESLRPTLVVADRAVIVVDDGVATGMTMQAALRQARRRKPSRLIAAAPVASREALAMLGNEADAVVCLASPRRFGSVGSFYRSFAEVTDADVAGLLRMSASRCLPLA